MSAEFFLSAIIEAAVGIAGFAGIIAAIRQRNILHWPVQQRILLQMLLTASAAALTLALLPSVLSEAQVASATIWRVGSAALLIWELGIVVHRSRQFRNLEGPAPIPWFILAGVGGIILLQALNLVLGVSWPYLIGVFGMLVSGFSFFVLLLLGPNEDDALDTGVRD